MADEKKMTDAGVGSPDAPVAFRSSLVPLLLMTSIFFMSFIARLVQAPLMPTIEEEFGLSHGVAGSLFLAISVGYFIALLGSGFVSSRLYHKKTILLSTIIISLALFGIAFSSGIYGMRIGLVAVGIASGLYLPSAFAALTSMVNPQHWGKAIAIHELSPNVSFVAAPLVAEVFLFFTTWRSIYLVLGAIAALLALLYLRFGRGGEFPGEAPSYAAFRDLLVVPAFWIIVTLFSLAFAYTMGIYTMLPLYLTMEIGLDRNLANTLLAVSRVSGIGMAFVGGWAADRFGVKKTIGVVFMFTGLMTVLLGLSPAAWIPVIVFIQPMIAVCYFPAGFSALGLIGPPKSRNIAVGLTTSISLLIGGGFVPTVIGFMGDFGTFSVAFIVVGALVMGGALVSQFLVLEGVPESG